jgi:hypothetical protein
MWLPMSIAEHLPDIGRRVGADQQHPLPLGGQLNGRGAGDGGLADATLAGEEQEAGRLGGSSWHSPCSATAATSSSRRTTPLGFWPTGCTGASPAQRASSLRIRVAAGQGHLAIDQHQRQRLLGPSVPGRPFHHRILGESHGLLARLKRSI